MLTALYSPEYSGYHPARGSTRETPSELMQGYFVRLNGQPTFSGKSTLGPILVKGEQSGQGFYHLIQCDGSRSSSATVWPERDGPSWISDAGSVCPDSVIELPCGTKLDFLTSDDILELLPLEKNAGQLNLAFQAEAGQPAPQAADIKTGLRELYYKVQRKVNHMGNFEQQAHQMSLLKRSPVAKDLVTEILTALKDVDTLKPAAWQEWPQPLVMAAFLAKDASLLAPVGSEEEKTAAKIAKSVILRLHRSEPAQGLD